MFGLLKVISGLDQGKTFTIIEGQTLAIGRGETAQALLQDPKVSRLHCQVQMTKGKAMLTDVGSVAGTKVNGVKITAPHELLTGNVIRIGNTQISFQLLDIDEHSTIIADVSEDSSPQPETPEPSEEA